MREELDIVTEQLEELLAGPLLDADDVLELATLAGTLQRLGGENHALEDVVAWRDSEEGQEQWIEAFEGADIDALVEWIDNLDAAEEAEVEEALSDFDDLVVGAVWCGLRASVLEAAKTVAKSIRAVPDPFAQIADLGSVMARLPGVGQDLELYDYWLAVAEAGAWAESEAE